MKKKKKNARKFDVVCLSRARSLFFLLVHAAAIVCELLTHLQNIYYCQKLLQETTHESYLGNSYLTHFFSCYFFGQFGSAIRSVVWGTSEVEVTRGATREAAGLDIRATKEDRAQGLHGCSMGMEVWMGEEY